MKGEKVLCTGAAGSIGSELVRQLSKSNQVFGLDQDEAGLLELDAEIRDHGGNFAFRVGNIRDGGTVRDCFSYWNPQVVFHAAAYKGVDTMERMPWEAIRTNIDGTWNVVDAARTTGVEKFVFISSDKAVNGTSIMGVTKRFGEILTRNQGKGFLVVRFGNVKDSRGSVMRIWRRQKEQGLPLTVTESSMTRYWMSITEAVELTIHAAEKGRGGECFVLDMGEPKSIGSLVEEIGGAVTVIGIRPGEAMHEKLMSSEEEAKAVKEGRFWVIR